MAKDIMLETFKRVDNPLTIIAIFAGLTEVAASVALPFLDREVQQTFVWFLILFPFVLIAAFFVTLNFNTRALYAPADYRDDKHFLQALSLSDSTLQVSVKGRGDLPPAIEVPPTLDIPMRGMPPFDGISKAELDLANEAFKAFAEKSQKLFEAGRIRTFGFGIHGEGLFLLTVILNGLTSPDHVARIVRPSTTAGTVSLSVVGRGIRSSDPAEFAEMLLRSVESEIAQAVPDKEMKKN